MGQTLATRSFGKKASEITKEEFVYMMLEDIQFAKEAYANAINEQAEKKQQEVISRKTEEIIASSFKKYKRESYRLRWVESEIAKISETFTKEYFGYGTELKSIYWNIKPWSFDGGTSISLNSDKLEQTLHRIYDEASHNKYFLNCSGWDIVDKKFVLHLSDEMTAEWTADAKGLSDNVSRFYEGTKYWGD